MNCVKHSGSFWLGCLLFFGTLLKAQVAQDKLKGDYLRFSLGGQIQTFIDEFYSPLNYLGLGFNLGVGYVDQSDKWLNDLHLSGGFARLDNEEVLPGTSGIVSHFDGILEYRLGYAVWHSRAQKLFLGLSSLNQFNFREHSNFSNSAQSVAGFFNYGFSAEYQWTFALPDFRDNQYPMALTLGWDLPVGSYVLRPGFVRPIVGDGLGINGIYWWGDFFAWHNDLSLRVFGRNCNQISLTYRFAYVQFKELNELYQARHDLLVEFYLVL